MPAFQTTPGGQIPGLNLQDPTHFQQFQQGLEAMITGAQTAARPFASTVGTESLMGLGGATEAINRGASGGISELDAATTAATGALGNAGQISREDIIAAIQGGRAPLQSYAGSGTQANDLQAALSGAQGQQAQQQAINGFVASPEQQFMRDRSEQALVRNAAATGDLESGALLNRLQENATGLAAQDFQNMFARLGTVADRGLTSAGALGSLGEREASLLSQSGLTTGSNMANVLADRGVRGADIFTRAGEGLADYRTGAARDIAGAATDTGTALAELLAEQGIGAGGDVMGGTQALTSLITNYGELDAETQRVLGNMLAQLGLNEGQGLASLWSGSGDARLTGDLASATQFRDGVGDMSDFGGDIGNILGAFM